MAVGVTTDGWPVGRVVDTALTGASLADEPLADEPFADEIAGDAARFAVLFESGVLFSHAMAKTTVASISFGKRIDLSSNRMSPTGAMQRVRPKHVACHQSTHRSTSL